MQNNSCSWAEFFSKNVCICCVLESGNSHVMFNSESDHVLLRLNVLIIVVCGLCSERVNLQGSCHLKELESSGLPSNYCAFCLGPGSSCSDLPIPQIQSVFAHKNSGCQPYCPTILNFLIDLKTCQAKLMLYLGET